jgi:DNA-binding transcriptional ArsR family regulator
MEPAVEKKTAGTDGSIIESSDNSCVGAQQLRYDASVIDVLTTIQALADPTRFAVFECVRCCGGESLYDTSTGECDGGSPGAIAACDVRCIVSCSPSSLSRHITALREAGLVETQRTGRKLYVRVVPEALQALREHFEGVSTRIDRKEKQHV